MEFRDGCDNVLRIEPTVGTLRRVRQRTNHNLLDAIVVNDAGTPELLVALADDDELLAEVLYAACSQQINATFDEWIERQTAEHMRAGHAALMQALPLFFRHPEQRTFAETLIRRLVDGLQDAMIKAVAILTEEPEPSGSNTPTTAPESLDSTPIQEPSENLLKPLTESSETSGTDSPH